MPSQLGKVKAHDEAMIQLGHPRAVGNDAADAWAKRAAMEDGHPVWAGAEGSSGDPVAILDAEGATIMDLQRELQEAWWALRGQSRAKSRPWLESIYPPGVQVDWAASCGVFRRPKVNGNSFVHPVHPAVVKWLGRLRAGCLASRARLVGHGLVNGLPQCLCCGADVEDDEHMVAGCAATGTREWPALVAEAWEVASKATSLSVPVPPVSVSCRGGT